MREQDDLKTEEKTMNNTLLITLLAALIMGGGSRASAEGGMAEHKGHAAAAMEHTDCLEQWEGVKTEKKTVKNWMEFTLTAETPAAVDELRAKAAAHLKADCPLFKDAGEIAIENIENGAKVTIMAGKQAAAAKPQGTKKMKHGCACCGGGEEKEAAKTSTAAYVCPMGCSEADKPGKCPKCGMNLVENKKAGQAK